MCPVSSFILSLVEQKTTIIMTRKQIIKIIISVLIAALTALGTAFGLTGSRPAT